MISIKNMKIKEKYKVENYSVLSDIGWIPITYCIKTEKIRKYLILFESGIKIECADDHKLISIDNEELFAKNINIGDKIKSKNGYDIVFDVFDTEEEVEMYDLTLDHHHLYYTNEILSHNSNTMANFAARQVMHGHNVVLLTLEMSEDAFAQRFDGIYSCLDINRMYLSRQMKNKLFRTLREKRNTENRGELYIKQYPTGDASISDFRIYLRELMLRGIKSDIVYVDYINLMKSAYKVENNMYSSIKRVSEELRALSLEFNCPIVSVSQLNREGFFIQFSEVNFNHIAESMGIPATADFMAIMGTDEEQMIYESEILYKITKSRIGGRVGAMDKFYLDKRSLKMYDSSELDTWIEEATISGDDRERLPEQNEEDDNRRRRRRRD